MGKPARMDTQQRLRPYTLPLPSPPAPLSRGSGRGSHAPVGQDGHPCRNLGVAEEACLGSVLLRGPGEQSPAGALAGPSGVPVTPAASSTACESGPPGDAGGYQALDFTCFISSYLSQQCCKLRAVTAPFYR